MRKLYTILTYLILSQGLYALEISNLYNGFDHSVRYNDFNFITFTVYNNSNEAFEGDIRLREESVGTKTVNRKKIFLAPQQRKSIQMYFFLQNEYSSMQLEWGKKKSSLQLPKPSPVTNIYIGTNPRRLPQGIKFFNADHFPHSVTYTKGLNAVTLDSNPDWSPKQKQAFMDWLELGGQLYILKGQSGKFPLFTSYMSPINNTQDIGNGRAKKVNSFNEIKIPSSSISSTEDNSQQNLSELIFTNLQLLVKTDHNWTLIYFLIIVYLALIGPANYLIGRKTRDWKVPNLFFLAIVIVFSILFSIIGRRGYGESTKIHSFTLADHINKDQYFIKQWSNIFVTSGDNYSLTHKSSGAQYASPSNYEMSTVIDQSNSSFIADIPLFSSKQMIYTGKSTGTTFDLGSFEQQKKISLKTKAKITKAWFLINGKIYNAHDMKDSFTVGNKINYSSQLEYNSSSSQAYKVIQQLVLKKCRDSDPLLTPIHKASPYFFALTISPKSFHSQGPLSQNESGWTLHRFKLKPQRAL
jgi:hypothetical protein